MENQAEQHQKWWQQLMQQRVAIGVGAIVFVVVIALIIIGYRFDWTGFNSNNKSGKTLWDWLQLLFVPGVLTLGAVWFAAWHNHDLQIAERQREADRELAVDKYREDALETYLDKMSDLLLKEGLCKSGKDSEQRIIAQAWTLTVLTKLDPSRKRTVLKFLFESGLIDNNNPIVNLSYANLKEADLYDLTLFHSNLEHTNLSYANLEKASLSGTNLTSTKMQSALLREADLNQAILFNADLRNATLEGANLNQAWVTREQLAQAKSLKGATMPDGSIHP
jgi:hypothetical protein